MPLEQNVRHLMRLALAATPATPATPTTGAAAAAAAPLQAAGDAPRLLGDGRRLWRRVQRYVSWNLVHHNPDLEALELACLALQLPMRRAEALPIGRLGVTNLRDRAERAAQRLVEEVGDRLDPGLLDRTTRLLYETPQRPPVLEDAKLLADAVNLDDFGAIGLLRQVMELGLRGEGVDALAEGWEKRAAYGYWEARLRDGFHFAEVRAIARRRFDNARRIADLLAEERREDGL